MKGIENITKENFDSRFNIMDVLSDSVFYPASGIDTSDIECLSNLSNSFVHVDYSTSKVEVEKSMRNSFESLGYDLIGFKHVSNAELTPNGFQMRNFIINEHERERLNYDFIRDRFNCRNFTPYACWAVYELNPNKTGLTKGKVKRFSLLHIGGEACATFEVIYTGNKINPLAVSILSPGEGFGDNWTKFSDPEFRLYQNLLHNNITHLAPMPKFLLTDRSFSQTESNFWPDYNVPVSTCNFGSLHLYGRNQE
jgi:hypothetical protein